MGKENYSWNIITEKNSTLKKYISSVWSRRLIFFLLAKRDIEVRFQKTAVGIGWLIIRPSLMCIMMFIVFGKLAGFSNNMDYFSYSLLILCGIVPWQYLAIALPEMTGSLPANRILVTHTYFPRACIPIATALGLVTDLLMGFIFLIVIAIIYNGINYSIEELILMTVVFLITTISLILFVVGIGLILSVLNTYYRDIQNLIPFLIQLGFFASPVGYGIKNIPKEWQWLLNLNPLTGIFESFRYIMLTNYNLNYNQLAYSLITSLVLASSGLYIYSIFDKQLADEV